MILPTKYVSTNECLLSAGAIILQHIREPTMLSALWEKIKSQPSIQTYERFVLALDMLYILKLIDINDSLLMRVEK